MCHCSLRSAAALKRYDAQELLACRMGCIGFLKELRATEREHQDIILRQLEKAWAAEIAAHDLPYVVIPRVQRWKEQYSQKRRRYKFLVLDGPSMFGKTSFSINLFGADKSRVIDCSGGKEPDLREYDYFSDSCLIFDELPLRTLLKHKKLMQAPATSIPLGASATQMYSYNVFVAGKGIIVTTNHFEEEFTELTTAEKAWIVKNMFYFKVSTYLTPCRSDSLITVSRESPHMRKLWTRKRPLGTAGNVASCCHTLIRPFSSGGALAFHDITTHFEVELARPFSLSVWPGVTYLYERTSDEDSDSNSDAGEWKTWKTAV